MVYTGAVVTAARAEREKGGRVASQGDVDGAAEPVSTGTGCQRRYCLEGTNFVGHYMHIVSIVVSVANCRCIYKYSGFLDVHLCNHTHTHAHTHTRGHTHTHVYIHARTRACVHSCTCSNTS